jgi:hypothetical protein
MAQKETVGEEGREGLSVCSLFAQTAFTLGMRNERMNESEMKQANGRGMYEGGEE